MGYNTKEIQIQVHVVEDHIRAKDLATLVWAVDRMYEILAVVFVHESKPFENHDLRPLPIDALLRVTKLWSGSDASFSFLGIDKVIEVVRKIVEDIRFRKERRIQEEEKTKQSHQKTLEMELKNLRDLLDAYQEFKKLSPDDRENVLQLAQQPAALLEENRNTVITK